ncbi:PREDICTED: phenylalanine ammonia-lyase-like [Nelumbo nucifera]|uniref:Phenylalanine ammonia-lyase-like n=1 Tax=Nelumbo nucifera TaxID=4432 RepID=A0A1U8A9L9_NELNU|nr:PREDICTED: phenylalanine ammonia-lyase-like [Nelumbo nucifera]
MVALCQAIDLRYLEENMREVVKHILDQVVRKTLYTAQDRSLFETRFCKKELLQVIEYLPVFSFLDDPTNPSYALLLQLREFLVEKALNQLPREEESTENGYSIFKARLEEEIAKDRRNSIMVISRYPTELRNAGLI